MLNVPTLALLPVGPKAAVEAAAASRAAGATLAPSPSAYAMELEESPSVANAPTFVQRVHARFGSIALRPQAAPDNLQVSQPPRAHMRSLRRKSTLSDLSGAAWRMLGVEPAGDGSETTLSQRRFEFQPRLAMPGDKRAREMAAQRERKAASKDNLAGGARLLPPRRTAMGATLSRLRSALRRVGGKLRTTWRRIRGQ